VWDPALAGYRTDRAAESTLTRVALLASLSSGDSLTFTAVPPGLGTARGRDRNENGIPDADEPPPLLSIVTAPAGPQLRWPAVHGDWYPEASNAMESGWMPFPAPAFPDGSYQALALEPATVPSRFIRLRRTW
jgi:hypothetical protein